MSRLFVLCLAAVMVVSMPLAQPLYWTHADAKTSKSKKQSKSERKSPSRSNSSAERQKQKPKQKPEPFAVAALPAIPPVAPRVVWPLTLTLSTDKPAYRAGDLITITVVADAACDLTLISIDGDGFASVVFPNEYEPDNLLNANVPVSIPRRDGAYQLRVKGPTIETLLGICSPPGTRPRGIVADYERYRFTLVGDWAEFTSKIDEREKEIVKAAAEAERRRRRRDPPLPPLLPPSDPSEQGRSLLLVPVNE